MWKNESKKRTKYYDEVIRLYTQERLGCLRISRIIPVSRRTVSLWIRNFVEENRKSKSMTKFSRPKAVPAVSDEGSTDIKTLQLEISRLKKQLAHESLRADAYEELINVAEKQFNISIRKKAGTKQ